MSAAILRRAANAKNAPLTAQTAARFLWQTTNGPTPSELSAATGQRPAAWIDSQMAMAIPQTAYAMDIARGPTGVTGVWTAGLSGSIYGAISYRLGVHNDAMRNRVVTALIEYFSVGAADSFGTQGSITNFYTILETNCFGNFRTLIEAVSRSLEMCIWLTYWRNEKADGPTGRQPDENYARELMQLYTIGLWELRRDGSRKPAGELDPSDPRYIAFGTADVPTYNQTDIVNVARVFTGMSARDTSNALWGFTFQLPGNATTQALNGWATPLEYDNTRHETVLSKVALQGRVNIPGGTNGDPSLDALLDALVEHPSMAPFFATRMIRLLTTSNPSPAYIARVASVFENDGTGTRGNLAAVFKAIFMDQEARAPASKNLVAKALDVNAAGIAVVRAFPPLINDSLGTALPVLSGAYPGATGMSAYRRSGGTDANNNATRSYQLMRAPSVFGRWPSTYAPAGPVLNAGMIAPELNQYNENGASYIFNALNLDNFHTAIPLRNSMPTAHYTTINSDIAGLVDELALLLTADTLPSSIRSDLVADVTALSRTTDDQRRTAWASLVMAIINTPYFIVRT